MCITRDDIVSKSLIASIPCGIYEKLTDNFCLQFSGWCLCLNYRNFDPQPMQPVQLRTKSKKEMLRLKRRAPENLREVSKKSHIEDSENTSVAEWFQFDCSVGLEVLHKYYNTDMLEILLIYTHSSSGRYRVMHIYQSNPSWPC